MYRKKLNSARECARRENRDGSVGKIPRFNLFEIERESKIALEDQIRENIAVSEEIKRNTPFIFKVRIYPFFTAF